MIRYYRKKKKKVKDIIIEQVEHQCLGFVTANNDIECLPVDIQLYTWSGPGFKSGECWYQGHRFANGVTWGRADTQGSPYCICEQGKIRIFYSQQQQQHSIAADPLTILRSINGTLPTAKDLSKWPTGNFPTIRQRLVICSRNRTGLRIRSRDGCIGCKCSQNGHWLCRKAPPLNRNRTVNPQSKQISRNHPSSRANTYRINLHISTVRIQPECSLGSIPKFCILIERLSSASNISTKLSRYIEIPRETSWIDRSICTRCSCTLDGKLKCEFINQLCTRPCLLHKIRPISIMYYFPSGTKWLTPENEKCRSCMCINGQRKCINCDQIIKIDVSANNNNDKKQLTPDSVGYYRLVPTRSNIIKATPCLLQTSTGSHRLIFPGQLTWFEKRCYFCSQRGGRLIIC
ncbi:unnamed protein product [Rotaria sordida]|uniref:Uncharacterized protein n=1 Tax=Rotaria sordida TaxID=392033 RepID=A0A814PYI2_9BILA|nr:unnamed protein product [Rotaria sordida]